MTANSNPTISVTAVPRRLSDDRKLLQFFLVFSFVVPDDSLFPVATFFKLGKTTKEPPQAVWPQTILDQVSKMKAVLSWEGDGPGTDGSLTVIEYPEVPQVHHHFPCDAGHYNRGLELDKKDQHHSNAAWEAMFGGLVKDLVANKQPNKKHPVESPVRRFFDDTTGQDLNKLIQPNPVAASDLRPTHRIDSPDQNHMSAFKSRVMDSFSPATVIQALAVVPGVESRQLADASKEVRRIERMIRSGRNIASGSLQKSKDKTTAKSMVPQLPGDQKNQKDLLKPSWQEMLGRAAQFPGLQRRLKLALFCEVKLAQPVNGLQRGSFSIQLPEDPVTNKFLGFDVMGTETKVFANSRGTFRANPAGAGVPITEQTTLQDTLLLSNAEFELSQEDGVTAAARGLAAAANGQDMPAIDVPARHEGIAILNRPAGGRSVAEDLVTHLGATRTKMMAMRLLAAKRRELASGSVQSPATVAGTAERPQPALDSVQTLATLAQIAHLSARDLMRGVSPHVRMAPRRDSKTQSEWSSLCLRKVELRRADKSLVLAWIEEGFVTHSVTTTPPPAAGSVVAPITNNTVSVQVEAVGNAPAADNPRHFFINPPDSAAPTQFSSLIRPRTTIADVVAGDLVHVSAPIPKGGSDPVAAEVAVFPVFTFANATSTAPAPQPVLTPVVAHNAARPEDFPVLLHDLGTKYLGPDGKPMSGPPQDPSPWQTGFVVEGERRGFVRDTQQLKPAMIVPATDEDLKGIFLAFSPAGPDSFLHCLHVDPAVDKPMVAHFSHVLTHAHGDRTVEDKKWLRLNGAVPLETVRGRVTELRIQFSGEVDTAGSGSPSLLAFKRQDKTKDLGSTKIVWELPGKSAPPVAGKAPVPSQAPVPGKDIPPVAGQIIQGVARFDAGRKLYVANVVTDIGAREGAKAYEARPLFQWSLSMQTLSGKIQEVVFSDDLLTGRGKSLPASLTDGRFILSDGLSTGMWVECVGVRTGNTLKARFVPQYFFGTCRWNKNAQGTITFPNGEVMTDLDATPLSRQLPPLASSHTGFFKLTSSKDANGNYYDFKVGAALTSGNPAVAVATPWPRCGEVIHAELPAPEKKNPALLAADEFTDSTDFTQFSSLVGQLMLPANQIDPISAYLSNSLLTATRQSLMDFQASGSNPAMVAEALAKDLNNIIGGTLIYNVVSFTGVSLRPETQALLSQAHLTSDLLLLLNRLLLEDKYPQISRDHKDREPQSPLRVTFAQKVPGKIWTLVALPEARYFPADPALPTARLRDIVSGDYLYLEGPVDSQGVLDLTQAVGTLDLAIGLIGKISPASPTKAATSTMIEGQDDLFRQGLVTEGGVDRILWTPQKQFDSEVVWSFGASVGIYARTLTFVITDPTKRKALDDKDPDNTPVHAMVSDRLALWKGWSLLVTNPEEGAPEETKQLDPSLGPPPYSLESLPAENFPMVKLRDQATYKFCLPQADLAGNHYFDEPLYPREDIADQDFKVVRYQRPDANPAAPLVVRQLRTGVVGIPEQPPEQAPTVRPLLVHVTDPLASEAGRREWPLDPAPMALLPPSCAISTIIESGCLDGRDDFESLFVQHEKHFEDKAFLLTAAGLNYFPDPTVYEKTDSRQPRSSGIDLTMADATGHIFAPLNAAGEQVPLIPQPASLPGINNPWPGARPLYLKLASRRTPRFDVREQEVNFYLPPGWTGSARVLNRPTQTILTEVQLIHATTAPRARPRWSRLEDDPSRGPGQTMETFSAVMEVNPRSTGALRVRAYWNEYWDEPCPLHFVEATVDAQVSHGAILLNGVAILQKGDGYGSQAWIRFESNNADWRANASLPVLEPLLKGGQLDGLTLRQPGSNLPLDLRVRVLRRPPLRSFAQAVVFGRDSHGGLVGVTVTAGGVYYDQPPQVVFHDLKGDGAGALATAELDEQGRVVRVQLSQAGTGYSDDVEVGFYTNVKELGEYPVTLPGSPCKEECRLEQNGVVFCKSVSFTFQQDFGDACARDVSYVGEGSSRFRNLLADNTARSRISLPQRLHVRATARPPRPEWHHHAYSYRWFPGRADNRPIPFPRGAHELKFRREGAIRCYLRRGWHARGEEFLGVVVIQTVRNGIDFSPPTTLSQAERLVASRWGYDPIWDNAAMPPLALDDLTNQVDFIPFQNLDVGSSAEIRDAGVALHQVQYDPDKELWFADIGLRSPPHSLPFLQLAIARYQANALDPLQISDVILPDLVRIPGDRQLHLERDRLDACLLTISLKGPFGPAPKDPILPNRQVLVEVRRRQPELSVEIEGPLVFDGNKDVPDNMDKGELGSSRVELIRANTDPHTFQGRVVLPAGGQNLYLRVIERELYAASEPQRDITGDADQLFRDTHSPDASQLTLAADWRPFTCAVDIE